MAKSKNRGKVPIRPGVSILSVLSRLNYKPWFALAEFVDNSLQSFLDNRAKLKSACGQKCLTVLIDIDETGDGRISIRDNAFGISEKRFPYAFRPAELPPDRSGLHEYGMGMKSAACWFSPVWEVRTSALGNELTRTVRFDLKKIVDDNLEELDVMEERSPRADHFTEVVLDRLHRPIPARTLGKIREHLASIYRKFLENGLLIIKVNGQSVSYETPKILRAPIHSQRTGRSIIWKKKIDISLTERKRVTGFVAIRETGSTSHAGLALFRKNRLILGSADETYRPADIFGPPNAFSYQRLFGELDLIGFDVSHTKDGFVWEADEENLKKRLLKELSKKNLPIMEQADRYRVREPEGAADPSSKSDVKERATTAAKHLPKEIKLKVPLVEKKSLRPKPKSSGPKRQLSKSQDVTIHYNGQKWSIHLEIIEARSIGDLIQVGESRGAKAGRKIKVTINLGHPFAAALVNKAGDPIDAISGFCVSIAIAEIVARESGIESASYVRNVAGAVLRELSKGI